MSDYLKNMKFPEDIKTLNNQELEALGQEIRKFLVKSVSKTGGHLASNLGIVELTMCLFKCFDLEKDKIIYDVGHQSYVHKILTGRKDKFSTLRQKDGICGFPKRNESKYDAFDTGHSSTSISAAIGMARARDIMKKDYHVVAVIGDGALTGGLAFEALNDIGFNKTKLTIIFNDNQMSIANNVGALSKYFNNIRIQPGYNNLKNGINERLKSTDIGRTMMTSISKIKGSIKQLVVPSMIFEDMGIKYVGPIDGHNIEQLIEVFDKTKDINGPVVIHINTQKGKGYELAEKSPWKFHGIGPFNMETGEVIKKQQNSYSKEFGTNLIDMAREDEKIVAITAAMPDGTGLRRFSKEFPDRFFDVGIAEEHAVTMAAGMACVGIKPVFAVYSTFLQRAYDEILHDVCIQNLPVIFCIDRAGVVGQDGETHQGIMDISYLSMMPNMTIMAPKCIAELKYIMKYAINKNSPVAIRYPKGDDFIDDMKPVKNIEYGKWEEPIHGRDKIAIIATGKMVQFAYMAAQKLKEQNIECKVINALFIKPLDEEMLNVLNKENYTIVTVEDNILHGGLGEAIDCYLYNNGFRGKIENLGYRDRFVEQDSVNNIYKEYGLDAQGIEKTVKKLEKVEE